MRFGDGLWIWSAASASDPLLDHVESSMHPPPAAHDGAPAFRILRPRVTKPSDQNSKCAGAAVDSSDLRRRSASSSRKPPPPPPESVRCGAGRGRRFTRLTGPARRGRVVARRAYGVGRPIYMGHMGHGLWVGPYTWPHGPGRVSSVYAADPVPQQRSNWGRT